MQYAEIAVNTKTSLDRQTFTYSIPPQLLPNIKLGVLVLVPFHGRKINGIIISLKSHSPYTLNLKPILKIIDLNPVLDDIRLELAQWMSKYYLTPIGEVVFSMIPPTAMRQIKNNTDQPISKLGINQMPHKKAIAFLCGRKSLGNIYTLYGRLKERVASYIQLIDKSIQKNKSCIILFPNIEQAKAFGDLLNSSHMSSNNSSSDKKVKSVIYHSDMTKTQRYNIWNNIREDKYQVVIGTRPTIFLPVNNLGLIIIDQGENFGYKEEQYSKYHSLTVAKKLSQLTGANLVLGDLVPSVENYYFEQTGKYLRLQDKPVASVTQITKRIIDLNTQKNKIISWELEESIKSTLEKNGKILLFSQRKGEGSSLICQDCRNIFKCDKCGLPYVININPKSQIPNLQCHRCNIILPIPTSCFSCHGTRLKTIGFGIDKIQSEVSKLFPNVKTISIDVDSINIYQQIEKNQIIISTKKILDFYDIKFDLVGVISVDNLLNLPDYKIKENIYLTIANLMYQTKNILILQTQNPENLFWNYIKQSCPEVFLQKELIERKISCLPPFSQLIKFTYQNVDNNKCIVESQNFRSQIECLELYHLGPTPAFISKIRGKYQYQMLVTINNSFQKKSLKKIISNLPKGWKIDVDPISLI